MFRLTMMLLIICALSSLASCRGCKPVIYDSDKELNRHEAKSRLTLIQIDLNCYYHVKGEYPPTTIDGKDGSETLAFYLTSGLPEMRDVLGAQSVATRQGWLKTDEKGNLVFLGPWGDPIRYKRVGTNSCMIWDIGPNGIDENGGGDDMCMTLKDGK